MLYWSKTPCELKDKGDAGEKFARSNHDEELLLLMPLLLLSNLGLGGNQSSVPHALLPIIPKWLSMPDCSWIKGDNTLEIVLVPGVAFMKKSER